MRLSNGFRIAFFALVFGLLSSGYLITMIPAGPTYRVEAEVTSRTSRSGATGNTGVLICELKDGRRITVELPAIASVQTGDTVFLDANKRYFISPKYRFAGKRIASK